MGEIFAALAGLGLILAGILFGQDTLRMITHDRLLRASKLVMPDRTWGGWLDPRNPPMRLMVAASSIVLGFVLIVSAFS